MATPWDTALAAINYIGTEASADISPNGGTVKQTCRGCIEFSSITPTDSTIAGWFKYENGTQTSLNTLLYCGPMESVFGNGLWVYMSTGTITAATALTYRDNATLSTGTLPSTVDFSTWQHLAFTNASGTVTGYLNGTSFSFGTSVPNPTIQAIGIDTEGVRKVGLIGAGLAVWDSVLSGADLAWLADPANRPDPTSTAGGVRQVNIRGGADQ